MYNDEHGFEVNQYHDSVSSEYREEPVGQTQREQQFRETCYDSRVNTSHIPPERPRRKGGLAGRIAGVTAAAVLFGTVAGGTMFGVNAAGKYMMGRIAPEAETKAPVDGGNRRCRQPGPDSGSQRGACGPDGCLRHCQEGHAVGGGYQQHHGGGAADVVWPYPAVGGAQQRFRNHRGTE